MSDNGYDDYKDPVIAVWAQKVVKSAAELALSSPLYTTEDILRKSGLMMAKLLQTVTKKRKIQGYDMALKDAKVYRLDLNNSKPKPKPNENGASQSRRPQFDGPYGKHTSEIYKTNKEKYDAQAEEANAQVEPVSVRGTNELQTKSIRALKSAVCTSSYILMRS